MVEAAEPGTGSQRCRQRHDEGPQRAQASPQGTPLPQSIIPSRSLRPSGVFGALRAPQGQGAALFFTCFLGRSARPSNKAEKGTREQSRARPRCEVFAIRGLLGRVREQPLPYKVSPYRVEVLGAYIITRGQWRMRDTLALLPSMRGIRSFSCFSPWGCPSGGIDCQAFPGDPLHPPTCRGRNENHVLFQITDFGTLLRRASAGACRADVAGGLNSSASERRMRNVLLLARL